ncbi:MAG: DUF922 domain-containing protein [Aridibacter famidurans]|nr:DUF922 domain-containing protein [Aridibacter famidurans]
MKTMKNGISRAKQERHSGASSRETRKVIAGVYLQLCFLILLTLTGSQSAAAQLSARADQGFQAGNSYAISDIESINMNSGNVSMSIPLASLPKGRGTSPGFTISLTYNSKLWDSVQHWEEDGLDEFGNQADYVRNLLYPTEDAGWNVFVEYQLKVLIRTQPNPAVTVPREEKCVPFNDNYSKNGYQYKVQMRMPGGGMVTFVPYGTGHHYEDFHKDGFYEVAPNGKARHAHLTTIVDDPQLGTYASCTDDYPVVSNTGMHYYSTDGSNIRLFVPYNTSNTQNSVGNWIMYYPNGTTVENAPPDDTTIRQRITDANGNRVYIKSDSHNGISGTKIIDDLDRFIFYGGNKVISFGVNGAELETTLSWKNVYVYRHYKTLGLGVTTTVPLNKREADLIQSLPMLEKITLPTQASSLEYLFTYHADDTDPISGSPPYTYTDGWGELASVELPSGAKAEYSYDLPASETTLTTFLEVVSNKIIRKDLKYDEIYDGSATARVDSWLYDISTGYGSVTGPDGGTTTQHFYDKSPYIDDAGTDWRSGLVYRITSPDGSKVEKTWQQQGSGSSTEGQPLNAYVSEEVTTITNFGGGNAFESKREYDYDQNSNLLETREYDWKTVGSGSYVLKRRILNTYYNQTLAMSSTTSDSNYYANPSSPAQLNLVKAVEVRDGTTTAFSRSEFLYDNGSLNPPKGNLTESRSWDSTQEPNLPSADGNGFKLSSAGDYIAVSSTYDSYGNVLTVTDANSVVTQNTFDAINGKTGLYPTKIEAAYGLSVERTTTFEYDFDTGLQISVTDADNNVTNETEYDPLGRPTKAITASGTALESWVRTEYNDLLRRVVIRADIETVGDGKAISVRHFDELGRLRLSRSLENPDTEDPYDEEDGIKVQTRYLFDDDDNPSDPTASNGVYTLSSNPYRASTSALATGEPTMGWSVSHATKTSTTSTAKTYSGASLPFPWGSNANLTGTVTTDRDANRTLVTDQAGKQRISKTNALGHLTDVWEITSQDSETVSVTLPDTSNAHGYWTSYTYDPLNNLNTVSQGLQTRTFTYTSLSRLKSAANPESGTITYAYDLNGNLTLKMDATNVTTTYAYDPLNRITSRSYNDSITPPVSYTYWDPAIANSKGRLTKVSSSVSETRYTKFDLLGRIEESEQRTPVGTETVLTTTPRVSKYKYNLSGALVEQEYPSTRVVKNTIDDVGRLSMVQASKNSSSGLWSYADSFSFNAAGAVTRMQLGNGTWEKTDFNARLQPTAIALGSTPGTTNLLNLTYEYNTETSGTPNPDNNGNVLKQTIVVPSVGVNPGFTGVQTYSYDQLNRIGDASEHIDGSQTAAWTQDFSYDRYGNRNFNESTTTTLTKTCGTDPNYVQCAWEKEKENPEIDKYTNRIKELQPDGDQQKDYEFDAAGNMILDPDGRQFFYDGENKQITVKDNSNNVIGEYWYDGDGKRVKKHVPSTSEVTVFVYDAGGKLVAEYSTNVAQQQDAQVSYLTNDHLGSPRITTDKNGKVFSRRDFLPFGEDLTSNNTIERNSTVGYRSDDVRQKFTSKERDSETGLDSFGARYFSSRLARFSGADLVLVDAKRISDPQMMNAYSYVRNSPLIYVDPDGNDPVSAKTVKVIVKPPPNPEIRRYPVDGEDDVEAWKNANLEGPKIHEGSQAGRYVSKIRWEAEFSPTNVTKLQDGFEVTVSTSTITLSIADPVIFLPEWKNEAADAQDQEQWQNEVSRLERHERDHHQVAITGVNEIIKPALEGMNGPITGKARGKTPEEARDAAIEEASKKINAVFEPARQEYQKKQNELDN